MKPNVISRRIAKTAYKGVPVSSEIQLCTVTNEYDNQTYYEVRFKLFGVETIRPCGADKEKAMKKFKGIKLAWEIKNWEEDGFLIGFIPVEHGGLHSIAEVHTNEYGTPTGITFHGG